ncbi:MAG: signal peptidase II [Desulfatirhabdiaceae bacterium]|nr:signal peptidase II [Desulfatirhabdiaceae bacterium]
MVSGSIVVLDQISKMIVLRSMPLYESIPIIPGFFNLTHIHNPGGAFGFMASQGPEVRSLLFLAMSSLAAVAIVFFYLRTPVSYSWLSTALLLIFGGAIGNMIDRVRFGEVVDFLDFYAGGYHWPAFNVADSGISVGMAILVYHLLFDKMPE